MMLVPVPIGALDYAMDQGLSAVDASFRGEHSDDRTGRSVACAGDVNGDGYDDILIGTDFDDDSGVDAGQTYLILGGVGGWAMDTSLSNADASFLGEDAGDNAGASVAGAGDVNGDGYDDIIIGASADDNGGAGAGAAYLIFGKANGWAMDKDLSTADASFIGEDSGDMAGVSVDGAGDVNGDGYDDIIIGAWGDEDGGGFAGQTYLILGKADGWVLGKDLANSNASFVGEDSDDNTGAKVAGAGDVNGDGYDDILIGGYGDEDGGGFFAGQTYLILGKADGWAMDTDLANSNASFIGEEVGDESGMALDGAGDINGDGFDDIIIGAMASDGGGSTSGQAYIIFGKANGWVMDVDLSNVDASFLGEDADDWAGYSVAGAGDVNGDGFDDILIGAPGDEEGGNLAGQSYLILGKAKGWTMDKSLSTANASFRGESASDRSGLPVSGAGDVNGDGYDEILIAAFMNSQAGSNAGQTYLIFVDQNSVPSSIGSVKAYSDGTYSTVTSKADVNDTVFIELQGTDGNASRRDIALVNVTSSDSDHFGLSLRLLETGVNTGTYRGNLTIKNRTHEAYRWIAAAEGETVTVSSVQDHSKNVSITVGNVLRLYPAAGRLYINEDQPLESHFWATGPGPRTWKTVAGEAWMHWDGTKQNLSGTPDNSDVGDHWFNITVSAGGVPTISRNYTITVKNVPPEINSTIPGSATEDKQYWADCNSTDDGQGTISWHLATNTGTWLKLDPVTGILNGIPRNENVGSYYVNVSVDDGNGGTDFDNLTLVVVNTNDPPNITSADNVTAYEDSLYSVQYTAVDVDPNKNLQWQLRTNASAWLGMNGFSGLLSGLPANEDVGSYWVNVTVTDTSYAYDFHNFTLTVVNVNDPPVMTVIPQQSAETFKLFGYQVLANDVDVGDVLGYSLDKRPDGMTIGKASGLINWTPELAQVGNNNVVINVTDGSVFVTGSFNITVLRVIPYYKTKATLLSPPNLMKVKTLRPNFNWSSSSDRPVNAKVYFDVFLSTNKGLVESKNPSVSVAQKMISTDYTPALDLVKGATYYWDIVPFDLSHGSYFPGECLNGPWSIVVTGPPAPLQNKKPVVGSISDATIKVGDKFEYQVVASDGDPADTLNYTILNRPMGMTISSTGHMTWVPAKNQTGEFHITVQVSDGKDNVTVQFKMTVKEAPKPKPNGLSMTILGILAGIVIAVVAALAVAILLIKRRGNKPSVAEQQAPAQPAAPPAQPQEWYPPQP
jgi:hypothetical protein